MSSFEENFEGWVVFFIAGPDVIPEGLTLELGLEPDRMILPDAATGREGAWQLNSPLAATEPLDRHIVSMLEKLQPLRHRLREISRRSGVRLEFYVAVNHRKDKSTAMSILPRTALLIGHLGAALVFEVNEV